MSAFKDFLFNNDYSYLLQIAIILLSTKLLGLLTKRISLPQVVGALAAGIILGPVLLAISIQALEEGNIAYPSFFKGIAVEKSASPSQSGSQEQA